MSETELVVQAREGSGKSLSRKLRGTGRMPAVLYGRGRDTVSITVDPRQLETILRKSGLNVLLDLTVEGRDDLSGTVALVKELQRDPVRGALLHADLYSVDLAQKVEVEVPVHLTGKPAGVDLGGVLDHMLREITLSCLPRSIPDAIDLDVSALEIGDVLHVSDLVLPPDVELITDAELAVAHVVTPTVAEEPVAEEAAEGVEVPVVGEEDREKEASEAGGDSESGS